MTNEKGLSICVVNYNTYFFTRLCIEKIREHTHLVPYEILVYDNGSTDESLPWLEAQDDVVLFRGWNNSRTHGDALDFLVRACSGNVVCTLCSDAHPVSHRWVVPMFDLFDGKALVGVGKEWGRLIGTYVCPSFLFARRAWLAERTFEHNWPEWDTGETLSAEAGKDRITFVPYKSVDFGGRFTPKPCDYDGLVWHAWWGTRRKIPGVIGSEVEANYHSFVTDMLRRKYALGY